MLQLCRGDGGALTFWLLLGATAAVFVICAASTSAAETTTLAPPLASPNQESQSGEVESNENKTTEERSVIGDIEKLKRVGEILQTVGEKVIPVLVQGNSQPGGDGIQDKSRGLQLIHGLKKEVDDLAKTKI